MAKYRIIGNMTGNSMDAVDLVLTEFDDDKMTDICSYSKAYTKNMQDRIENMRQLVFNKTKAEIESIPLFKPLHDDYIRQIASCINEMCEQNNIDKNSIQAIGFHGKTLDHNPPSKAKQDGSKPYTLQIGSGQMLADLTRIPVIYDFRSDPLMAGFDGAPLVPLHNAHISITEGDGCYYNGGNTSNFAIIINGKPVIGTDAGPFNEYTDSYVRLHTPEMFDKDGMYGNKGKLNKELLQTFYNFGKTYYETPLPKSGDPAYYHKKEIFQYINSKGIKVEDAIYNFEYFAAYTAVLALALLPKEIPFSGRVILFGGGWKNPVVKNNFENLLKGNAYILPQHQEKFKQFYASFSQMPEILFSTFGDYMEARLLADLARYRLENKAWEIPEIVQAGKEIICGLKALPHKPKTHYDDCICRAAKGWQKN